MLRGAASLKLWRDAVGRALLAVDFRPLGDAPFHVTLNPILDQGGVRIARWGHSPGFTFRDEALVKDGVASFGLVIPSRHTITYAHRSGTGRLSPGNAVLLRNCEPGSLGSAEQNSYVAVIVPWAPWLEEGGVQDLVGKGLPRNLQAMRLLCGYVAALERIGCGMSPKMAEAAAQHIVDLVGLLVRERLDLDTEDLHGRSSDARVAVAVDFMARNFREPSLSVGDVAENQGVSTRYLQQLFERAGIRYSDHINTLRLEAARRALVDPKCGRARISDIALECGFSDISHFNRLFRSAFGMTPGTQRSMASSATSPNAVKMARRGNTRTIKKLR